MTTIWTGSPVLSAASINELRTAVHNCRRQLPKTLPWFGPDGSRLCRSTLRLIAERRHT